MAEFKSDFSSTTLATKQHWLDILGSTRLCQQSPPNLDAPDYSGAQSPRRTDARTRHRLDLSLTRRSLLLRTRPGPSHIRRSPPPRTQPGAHIRRSLLPWPSHGAATASVAAQLLHAAAMPRHRGSCATTRDLRGLLAAPPWPLRHHAAPPQPPSAAHHGPEPCGSDTNCWKLNHLAPF